MLTHHWDKTVLNNPLFILGEGSRSVCTRWTRRPSAMIASCEFGVQRDSPCWSLLKCACSIQAPRDQKPSRILCWGGLPPSQWWILLWCLLGTWATTSWLMWMGSGSPGQLWWLIYWGKWMIACLGASWKRAQRLCWIEVQLSLRILVWCLLLRYKLGLDSEDTIRLDGCWRPAWAIWGGTLCAHVALCRATGNQCGRDCLVFCNLLGLLIQRKGID